MDSRKPLGSKSLWQRWRPWLQRFAIAYGFVCTALYFQQQRLMFFPAGKLEHTPSRYQLAYEEVWIPLVRKGRTQRLNGWWIPAGKLAQNSTQNPTRNSTQNAQPPVLLYFHHNAINIGANVSQAQQFHQLGYSIFLFDYRGFGKSEGVFPTEAQVYEDAEAAWTYLTQTRKIPPDRIVIYGHSIGGAIAIDLASKHPEAAALIVQSSFTSMRDMTKRLGIYWLLPVDLLLHNRFESLTKMASIQMPVLVMTGTEDVQIPVIMGERLHAAARGWKQLIIIPGGGHDNHLPEQYRQQLKQFIDRATQLPHQRSHP